MSDLIERQAAIDALSRGSGCGHSCIRAIKNLPSVQPDLSEIARDIATIIENEKDMRVILENSKQIKNLKGECDE